MTGFLLPVQPRNRTPEGYRFYRAVLELRRRGRRVYRGGRREAIVDGRRMTHKLLIRVVAELGGARR